MIASGFVPVIYFNLFFQDYLDRKSKQWHEWQGPVLHHSKLYCSYPRKKTSLGESLTESHA